MGSYRRFIRINNKLISSPAFARKKDAEDWYQQQRRRKQFLRDGLELPKDLEEEITFLEYSAKWIQKRMQNYPKSTWAADEQRLRDYILPEISEAPISSITSARIRALLLKISEEGYIKPGFTISVSTRTRIKALLSVIFSDALNEDPPLVKFNPVAGIRIKTRRIGTKKPRVLEDKFECLKFIAAAQSIGALEYAIACTFLMTGMRKQELIALRWSSIDFKNNNITIREKFEQSSNSIKIGTKKGENCSRTIPVSKSLIKILKSYQAENTFNGKDDFVFTINGQFLSQWELRSIIENISKKAQVKISAHGLRHTFGREFARNTGNLKALQAVLGHTSSQTTDIYSELAGSRLSGFNEAVSFSLGGKS